MRNMSNAVKALPDSLAEGMNKVSDNMGRMSERLGQDIKQSILKVAAWRPSCLKPTVLLFSNPLSRLSPGASPPPQVRHRPRTLPRLCSAGRQRECGRRDGGRWGEGGARRADFTCCASPCVNGSAGGRQHPAEGDAAADGRGVRPQGEEPVAAQEHQEPPAAAHQGHIRRHHQQARTHSGPTLLRGPNLPRSSINLPTSTTF